MSASKANETVTVRATGVGYGTDSKDHESQAIQHGQPDVVASFNDADGSAAPPAEPTNVTKTESNNNDNIVINNNNDNNNNKKKSWRDHFAFFKTKDFWLILGLGQILAICITGTNTLTTLLANAGTSIPAFQTLFNYVLLNLVYTSWTIYKYGFRKWLQLLRKDGWKYIILSFFDVEGNYFTVLAYRYTTILSAQLINFWAIVVVVVLSFTLLGVRYHWAQILGILVCIGGTGMLLASDYITSHGGTATGVSRGDQLKGDLFALLGASFYGLSNVYEEWFVSGRPLYEVIGQLAFWAQFINGVQAAIFDRSSFRHATWDAAVAGYLTGYTLILTIFYSLVPVLYRFASAAFQNVSLLTGNFWGVIIGLRVFHYTVHWMYPIAFVLIMGGHFVYYFGKGVLGEAQKAWLGENQEKGIDGFGSAKRRLKNLQQTHEEPVDAAAVV